ncbi:S1 family peptidase [Actinomadura rupiterrae]|uniref:S1 family peptidase n=1 Tax=Actinomadura rupiterrae TaxID=559627 RepID=UPI0020A4CED5|nr:S1 family peptidase [Actinomadura rupiterrae]MCP2339569.1 streptogrisin D [Actinomadura rupiterrae]
MRGPVVLGTALGLTAATLAAVPAIATAAPGKAARPATPSPQVALAKANLAKAALAKGLSTKLGGATAGSYVDDATGKLVVTVTSANAAKAVRAAGAEPRKVARSGGDLKKVMAALRRDASIPGTAWAADPKADQVVLSVDRTVTGSKLAKVKKAAQKHGAAVRLSHVSGKFRPLTAGGEAIWTSGGRCSLGFNVKKGSDYYFLTAGHCTAIGKSWSADQGGSKPLGDTVDGTFPGNDFGLVKYASAPSDTKGVVSLYSKGEQDITGAGDAVVGQTVSRSGSTTQVHDGKVTALDQTVNYQEGSVSGLIQTTVCAEPGDSGGSLFAGDKAVGLTSGGSGDCTSGGETFFQPVGPALSHFGVELY